MTDHDDGIFNQQIAATYDVNEAEMFDPAVVDPVLDVLSGLAAGKPALEFGIGTGRIAVPLAFRGVPVHGIDISNAMMEKIKAKPAGDKIKVTTGDFSHTQVDGSFGVVYLVFNTIMNLTSQAEQVACFQNAADHLDAGGYFVIEVMLPRLQWLVPGERLMTWEHSALHWGMDEYDIATQGLVSHHMHIIDGEPVLSDTPCRYVWPAELDLMAQLASMSLVSRWQDWQQTPFDSQSREHVSIWRKTASST